MAKIRIELTMEELQALLTLASNQFFRMKYIDPKIPGHKERPDELRAAQSAVQVLETALKAKKGIRPTPRRITTEEHGIHRVVGSEIIKNGVRGR